MDFRPSRQVRGGIDLSPLRAVSISITPLVDTMLVILIFVLLLGALAVQPGLRVRLPEAVTQDRESTQEVVLVLTRDDRLYLNDDPLEIGQLGDRLRERLRARSDAVVIIRADKEVLHGRVVEVMDIAKNAGAGRLSIATEPKASSPESRP